MFRDGRTYIRFAYNFIGPGQLLVATFKVPPHFFDLYRRVVTFILRAEIGSVLTAQVCCEVFEDVSGKATNVLARFT